jgi:serine/threonine protein kinase/tetratricopeptide (TPR) repeat protein
MPAKDPKSQEKSLDESLPPSSGQACVSSDQSFHGSRLAHEASFAAGDLLANRFRILHLISKGGMGEVYEAEDLELHERIAIKTILPDIANNPAAIEQFKREIQLARRVTHLNVCRIFDLVYDPRPSRPVAFLTMELLNGAPLSAYIAKRGTLTLKETLDFARQMAEGLNAAHRAGVIHQDFKSGNVMIVSGEVGERNRAVITDFGLAHNLRQAESVTGKIVGTPAFMAPEQIEGRPASPATDVYALGVVLYECVTGHLPYTAHTREELQQKKLHDAPVFPTKYIPDLPIRWERTILRCLSKEPDQRFTGASAVVQSLEPPRLRWRFWVAASIVLILLATLGGYEWRKISSARREVAIAVIGFQNKTGDPSYDWLSTELSEALTSELGDSAGVHTIPTDEVSQLKTELSVPPNQSMERENLPEVRQTLNANYLLMGSYTVAKSGPEETLNLDLHLEGVNGEPVSFHQSGPTKEYGRLVTNVATEIRQKLGRTRLPDAESTQLQNQYPSDPKARQLYFRALDKLRSFDAPSALSFLKQAVEAEPDNTVIHSALADTWSQLKHDHDAAEEAKKAADLARQASLPFEYVVLAQGRAEEMNKNWDAAIKDYGLLFPHYKRLNYGLQLAHAQMEGGHAKEALDTLRDLASLPPPIGSDPRIDIAKARVYGAASDFNSELASAQTALQEATQRNARLMQANAQLELCWAHQRLGHVDEAYAACNEAQNLFSAFGDNVSAAVALNDVASWLVGRSRYAEAKQLYDRVIQINQTAGAQKDLAGACLNAARVLDLMGKPDEAQDYIKRALEAAVPIGDKYNETLARILRGEILAKEGHPSEAEQEIQRALTLARETNNESTEALALSNLAQVQMETDTEQALATYRVVLGIRRQKGDQSAVATCLMNMGNAFFRSGDLNAASANYQEALGIDTQLKDKIAIGQDLTSLAEVDLERGNFRVAEDNTLQAIKNFRDNQDTDNEAAATSVLVRVLIAEKDTASAASHVQRIQEIASKDPETGFSGRLSIAEYLAATGKRDQAIQLLASVPTEAKNAGMNFISLKVRIELVRLKTGVQPPAELSEELSSIQAEARRSGFGLLVQQSRSRILSFVQDHAIISS